MRNLQLVGVTAALLAIAKGQGADKPAAPSPSPLPPSSTNVFIDNIWSTPWNYSTPGGSDANLIKLHKVNIAFKPISGNVTFPSASVNLTDGDAVIGIEVHDNRNLQQMYGAGCGVTDAASITWQQLKKNKPDEYKELMNVFFSQDPEWALEKGGAGLNIVRSPIGACDFGFALYSYDDTVDGSPDLNLTNFSIEKAPKLWQTHLDIAAVNGNVKRMFAPWSPPAWMKANSSSDPQAASMIGGQLQPEYYDVFAQYLAKSMSAIKQRLGSTPWQLSIQNEPKYLPPKYPGNLIEPTDAAKIGTMTRKYLDQAGLRDVTLTAYDHNWDDEQYPITVFDNSKAFGSVSWHSYSSTPDAQDKFNQAFPNTLVLMSEGTRITQNYEEPWKNLRTSSIAYLSGAISHGTSAIVLWNCALAVDDNGFTTPHLPDVCQNCLAPVLIPANHVNTTGGQSQSRRMARRGAYNVKDHERIDASQPAFVPAGGPVDTHGRFRLTSDFVLLGHLTRATRPRNKEEKWAVRVGASTTEEQNNFPDGDRVKVQAYKTSLGSDGKRRWSLQVLQKHDHFLTGVYNDVTVTIKYKDMVANVTLPVGLHTLTWVD